MADQRSAAPVLRDIAKHAMFNLVPFAGTGREVADPEAKADLVSQSLQRHFPQPGAAAVAAATVGQNQYLARLRIGLRPHPIPPTTDGRGGKLRRVMIHSYTHPAAVAAFLIDPIRNPFADFFVGKIMGPHQLRRSLRLPFPTSILKLSSQLLLLGI